MFGLNNAQLIGRLGADATISHLTNGGRVANVSIARPMKAIWIATRATRWTAPSGTGVVTFQDGLVDMMEKHAKKGRLVYVSGKLQTPQVAQGRRGQRPVLDRDPAGPPAAGCSSWTSRTATARRRRTARARLPPKPPRRRIDDDIPF